MIKDTDAFLQELIAEVRLPTLPTVALQLLNMRDRQRLDVGRMADLIRVDPALMGRTSLLVDEQRGGDPRASTRTRTPMRTSLLLLGARRSECLLDDLLADDQLRPVPAETLRFPYAQFWRRAVVAAVAAEMLVRAHTDRDPQDGWNAGLMQDVGQLALAEHLGAQYLRDVMRQASAHCDVTAEEMKALRVTHPQVSAALLQHWSFPPEVVDTVAHHEQAPVPADNEDHFRAAVYLAGYAASAFIRHEAKTAAARFALQAEHLLPIGAAQARQILHEIDHAARNFDALFTMDQGAVEKLRGLISGTSSGEGDDGENGAGESPAHDPVDPLTGLPDRGHFEQRLMNLMGLARATNQPLGVIQFDTGKPASERDLRDTERIVHGVADFLRRLEEPGVEPGRLGPQSFALACPDRNLLETSQLAERLRVQCAESWPDDLPSVTIHAGVAAREPDGHPGLNEVHILLRCASQASQAAQSAGGNCVRAFRPRPAARSRTASRIVAACGCLLQPSTPDLLTPKPAVSVDHAGDPVDLRQAGAC